MRHSWCPKHNKTVQLQGLTLCLALALTERALVIPMKLHVLVVCYHPVSHAFAISLSIFLKRLCAQTKPWWLTPWDDRVWPLANHGGPKKEYCWWHNIGSRMDTHITKRSVYKYTSKVPSNFYHFRNGAERSGLFCVALYVAQQIKTQQKVDIFSAVKNVRLYRPQCIANMVHFFHFFLDLFSAFCKVAWTSKFSLHLYYFRSSMFSSISLHRNTSHVRIN